MGKKENPRSSIIKRKILLLYPYYWPHYKAGGPVQSLFNLVSFFSEEADFHIISKDRDLDGQPLSKKIILNQWVNGPNEEKIFFTSTISPYLIYKLIGQIKPDVILLNGLFNFQTTLYGLACAKIEGRRVIISPRGMLQPWALKRGRFMKAVYLFLVKLILRKNEEWHATDSTEKEDILRVFGKHQIVHVASNIPRHPTELRHLNFPDKAGKIKLVFLSLINPNKNLHLVIEAVARLQPNFLLDIYGPIIDLAYWISCEKRIPSGAEIKYKGPIPPWEVPDLLSNYHFFVLPTQGENFGHAVFDSLASGVPVIISHNTPWHSLDTWKAGLYIDIKSVSSLQHILEEITAMSSSAYQEYRSQSTKYAEAYWDNNNYSVDYSFLFK